MSAPPPDAHPDTSHLGPIATDDSLRARVVRAAATALTEARAALTTAAADPHEATHAVRKALRKLRALVELVGRALPKRDRADIARGLGEARRALGPARDQHVARTVVDGVAAQHELTATATALHATAAPDQVAPEALVASLAYQLVVGALQHADLDIRLGCFNWIVPGPEMHRIHHHIDGDLAQNYALNLPALDLLFGTTAPCHGPGEVRMGVAGERD